MNVSTLALLSLALTSCVAPEGNVGLNPNLGDTLSQAATDLEQNPDAIDPQSPSIAYSPTKSPRYETALLSTPPSDANQSDKAANIAKDLIVKDPNQSALQTVPLPRVEPSTANAQSEALTLQNAQIASRAEQPPIINNAIEENAGSPTVSPTTQKPKEVKLNFFQRLMKARKDKETKQALAAQEKQQKEQELKLASKNPLADKNVLPGVKEGSSLFGITEENAKEEEEANVQVASVGALGRTVNRGLILQTSSVQVACFKPELMTILKKVERRYGKKVIVTSGYRSPARNRRAGGVKNSTHTYCKAADIQVSGVSKWDLAKYLRTVAGRGGVGTYCRTKSVHIDVGSVRDWHHPCRRRS